MVTLNPWSSPYFQRFWRQYYSSQQWCTKHWSVSYSLRSQDALPFLLPPPPPPPIYCPHKKRRRSKSKKSKNKKSSEEVNMEIEPSIVVDEDEIDVNVEFVEFLATSIRHRLESKL